MVGPTFRGSRYCMSINTASLPDSGFTTSAPEKSNTRWFVCALLFAATHHQLHGPLGPLPHRAASPQPPLHGLGLHQRRRPPRSSSTTTTATSSSASRSPTVWASSPLAVSSTSSAQKSATPSPSPSGRYRPWPLPRQIRPRLLHRPRHARHRRVRQLPRRHQSHH